MLFPSIRIEGAILSADLLQKIAGDDLPGQRPADFGLPPGVKVKDEIAAAWADAKDMWRIYQRRLDGLREGATGVSETRSLWIVPLLGVLGHRPEPAKAETLHGKSYAISHRLPDREDFPVHIMGCHDSLDKKRESGGPRMSPHGLLQEYLNLTEHLYGLVSNGRLLRLLRNSSRLIRLSFLEFDLERMIEDDLYADFAVLYRLLHATRFPARVADAPECWMETYHQESLDAGSRIREQLSRAITESIPIIANGFLSNPANTRLRQALADPADPTDATALYHQLLKLVYRFLFLFVIEDRDLVFPPETDRRKRDIYHRHYSLQRLRRLAETRHLDDERHHDHWQALLFTFRLFESGNHGEPLGIRPLAGDLFDANALGHLAVSQLQNDALLACIRKLCIFQHPRTHQRTRVNYAALNVEEFGSVYEGLLEYDAIITGLPQPSTFEPSTLNLPTFNLPTFNLTKGEGRSETGSHYTPDDLVQPLIRHSLDYLIAEKLKQPDPAAALLSLRVADISCGSGHILLAAARRIAFELAMVRTGEEQPSPAARRLAMRDVIRTCIYGVDLTPLAVELCKVALWLEAHVPGEPLNFLDHHIQCGNAIVGFVSPKELNRGIPDEAFKTLPGDDKDTAKALRAANKEQRKEATLGELGFSPQLKPKLDAFLADWSSLSALPESTPDEIDAKKARYRQLTQSARELRQTAHLPIAQFYLPKTPEHRAQITTHRDYLQHLQGHHPLTPQRLAAAEAIAQRKNFFHWFLAFPEIIQRGGFDCILGNPPYLGGQALSGTYGHPFCEYVKWKYAPTGLSELIAFFLRRIHGILKPGGFTAFITTNSIKDGDVRKDGLEQVMAQGSAINFAVRGIKWPGVANLVVSLLAIHKGSWAGPFELDGKTVPTISPFLEDSEDLGEPEKLEENKDQVFQGSIFLGDGFLLTHEKAAELIDAHPRNRDVIFPLINGREINNEPDQKPTRRIINFFDWTEEEARQYPEPFAIVEELVKPYRASQNRKRNREVWWIYAEHRPGLTRGLNRIARCFTAARTTKHLSFSAAPTNIVFSDALYVFTTDRWDLFSVVQSTLHEVWARKYSGSLETRLRYSPSDCFSTFAFPDGLWTTSNPALATLGTTYHEHRRQLMLDLWIGLTDTYNLFHTPDLTAEQVAKVAKCDSDKAAGGLQRIQRLRDLHVQLDHAVRDAYGWTDLPLGHDFHDIETLPENDRTRYTISPAARKELLTRLLHLNHQRLAEEQPSQPAKPPKTTRKPRQPKPTPDQIELNL
jgi:methylase of polypeptide subunit release factors